VNLPLAGIRTGALGNQRPYSDRFLCPYDVLSAQIIAAWICSIILASKKSASIASPSNLSSSTHSASVAMVIASAFLIRQ